MTTPTDLLSSLSEYVTADSVDKMKSIFDDTVSQELLVISAALCGLADSCDDAAQFADDDGRCLTAEGWSDRAARYRACFAEIVKQWDGDPTPSA